MNLQLTRRYVSWYFLVMDVPLGGLLLYLDVMSTLYQLSSPFADGNLRKTESQPVFLDWDYAYSVGVVAIVVLIFLGIHFGLLLMVGYAWQALAPRAYQMKERFSDRFWKCSVAYNTFILVGTLALSIAITFASLTRPDVSSAAFLLVFAIVISGIPSLGVYFSMKCVGMPEKVSD